MTLNLRDRNREDEGTERPAPGGGRRPDPQEPVITPPLGSAPGGGTMVPGGDASKTGGSGASSSGGGFSYTPPPFGGPLSPNYNFPDLPLFDGPDFMVPGAGGLYSDPGYQFRLSEGQRALEASAAAQGVLRSGGTLKDLTSWAQNFASQEYGNVWDRALGAYDRQYRGALDEYSPLLRQYELLFGAEQSRAHDEWQRAWDQYVFRINDAFRRQQMIFEAGVPG